MRTKPGDVVVYEAFGGVRREIVVEQAEQDVKNGYPGFDGHMVNDPGSTVWGYDDQIVSINGRRVR